MKFNMMDNNVSLTMNIFLIIANVINLVYNLPQIIKTYKTKSTGDFSEWFLLLRFVGNIIWIPYAIEINSLLLLINTIVTVMSSIFIGYYKIKEILHKRKNKIKNNKNNNYHIIEQDKNDKNIIIINDENI